MLKTEKLKYALTNKNQGIYKHMQKCCYFEYKPHEIYFYLKTHEIGQYKRSCKIINILTQKYHEIFIINK